MMGPKGEQTRLTSGPEKRGRSGPRGGGGLCGWRGRADRRVNPSRCRIAPMLRSPAGHRSAARPRRKGRSGASAPPRPSPDPARFRRSWPGRAALRRSTAAGAAAPDGRKARPALRHWSGGPVRRGNCPPDSCLILLTAGSGGPCRRSALPRSDFSPRAPMPASASGAMRAHPSPAPPPDAAQMLKAPFA